MAKTSSLLTTAACLCLWGGAALAGGVDCPLTLRVGFIDVEAGRYIRGTGATFADPPGALVLDTQRILRELGCTFTLVRRPLRRLHLELRSGQIDMVVAMSPSPELGPEPRFPRDTQGQVDPRWALGEARAALFVLRPVQAAVGERLEGAERTTLRVGVVRGSAHVSMAREQGFKVTEVTDLPRAHAMLQAGRLDAVLMPSITVPPDRYPDLVEMKPPLARQFFYLPLAPQFADAHPALAREIWHRFCVNGRIEFPNLPSCPSE